MGDDYPDKIILRRAGHLLQPQREPKSDFLRLLLPSLLNDDIVVSGRRRIHEEEEEKSKDKYLAVPCVMI